MYFCCEYCDEPFPEKDHICKIGVLQEKIANNKERINKAEHELWDVVQAVKLIIKNHAQELYNKKSEISIKYEDFERLWISAKLIVAEQVKTEKGTYWKNKERDFRSFLSDWLATHMILCQACPLFSTQHNFDRNTTFSKLDMLRKVCMEAYDQLGYSKQENSREFDLTTQQFIDLVIKENNRKIS